VARDGDQSIGILRHDPEAPALPAEARAALDDIERSRTWNRFRLDGIAQ
jgi:hypothetical protein